MDKGKTCKTCCRLKESIDEMGRCETCQTKREQTDNDRLTESKRESTILTNSEKERNIQISKLREDKGK